MAESLVLKKNYLKSFYILYSDISLVGTMSSALSEELASFL